MAAIDDEMIEAEGGKQKAESDNDEINLRKSVTSVSSACKKTLDNITLVPNPTTGELQITNYELQITSIEVFDVYGRKQKAESRKEKAEGNMEIDISHLPAGLYFVKIQTEAGEITKKIIKQ